MNKKAIIRKALNWLQFEEAANEGAVKRFARYKYEQCMSQLRSKA
ncbi:hypothetical protein [Paenibacillus radicis (ex Xue et al. 2023)]|uniref:Uncharacterized protein n=1 Tax=Paenibacillus radicis (ex Xue et al. 2023) TaxID=2972489 RepID=A0ABT1YN74_9BACL|nr:hypothetical protein [Paenibacillus radicis (ex Xue et al. 2023)]MCR8633450.1 hypothetical protein [Paenibacillus radicis (ex Xue et al. 2023)]